MLKHVDKFFFDEEAFADWLGEAAGGASPEPEKNMKLITVLNCGSDEIRSIDVSVDLDTVVSCSRSGRLLIHSLSKLALACVVDNVIVDFVVISKSGFVVACHNDSGTISCFSLNGSLLWMKCLVDESMSRPKALAISNGGSFLVACGYNSTASEWTMQVYNLISMEKVSQHSLESEVLCCKFTNDDTNLIAVLENGQMLVFTDPSTSLRIVDQMLRLGWHEHGLNALR